MKTIILTISLLSISPFVFATNWLMLQGTEPHNFPDKTRWWGFLQPDYQYTSGSNLDAGPYAGNHAAFNQIAPTLKDNDEIRFLRARPGLRGKLVSVDENIDYFFLAEVGQNGITEFENEFIVPTDWSMTFSHIPYLKLRIGQFKYPGSEEGHQGIGVYSHNNYTTVSNLMMLERFFDETGYDTTHKNKPNGAVGAFRDIGVQAFDHFFMGNWEHTYGVMLGQGNGLNRSDNNKSLDHYLYWSSEDIYEGKGPKREGLKLYAWYLSGKRSINIAPNLNKKFERKRYGSGITYRNSGLRIFTEYMWGDGMIFSGTDGGAIPGTVNNRGSIASFNMQPEEKGDGGYIDIGFRILPKLDVNLRYDRYNRSTRVSTNEIKFETWTLGTQYFIRKNLRVIADYEIRSAKAPAFSSGATVNQILDEFDDRFSVSALWVF